MRSASGWCRQWRSQREPVDAYVWRGVRTGQVEPPETYTADDFRVETFRSVAEAFPDHVLDIEIKVPGNAAVNEDDLAFAIEGARVLAELTSGVRAPCCAISGLTLRCSRSLAADSTVAV